MILLNIGLAKTTKIFHPTREKFSNGPGKLTKALDISTKAKDYILWEISYIWKMMAIKTLP